MKIKNIIGLTIIAMVLSSCFGDKKVVDVSEINDTGFVNKNFKGNKINYAKGMSACNQLNTSAIAALYNVSADNIKVLDPTTSTQRFDKNMAPGCVFYIENDGEDYTWLKGGITVNREVGKDEYMGEIAEATGSGKNWEEAWAMKKAMSKSAEWLPNIGKAALWNARKNSLEIKFEGYTLLVNPLTNRLNETEKTKNRDYKEVAITMAKALGYIN